MDITLILHYAVYAFLVLIPVFTFIAFYKINWNTAAENAGSKIKNQVLSILDDEEESEHTKYFDIVRMEKFLKSHGAYFIFPKIDVFKFLVVKFFTSLLLLLVAFSLSDNLFVSIIAGIIGLIIGFLIPDWIITIYDNSENTNMLEDIKIIFDTLKTQTKAGVFLTNSLSECYLAVSNERLKASLLDMTNKIIIKNDIEQAITEFNEEFNSPYIDTLCITIKQSMESGKSVQILSDLSKQIADMQSAINIKNRERLDSKIQVIELLLFVGAVAALIYVLGLSVWSSYVNF